MTVDKRLDNMQRVIAEIISPLFPEAVDIRINVKLPPLAMKDMMTEWEKENAGRINFMDITNPAFRASTETHFLFPLSPMGGGRIMATFTTADILSITPTKDKNDIR